MSKLQTGTHTTCLSFLPFVMRKEQHTDIVIQKRRDYISRESCVSEMAINTAKFGISSKNNFDSIPEDTHLFNSTISNHPDVIPLCSAIEKQPLSDNTKISNWVRMVECKGDNNNTSCFSNNEIVKEDIKRKPNARRRSMKILVKQTPLRQICKTNRRRSELLDMSDLKVLHSSLGRIFVTLSALAFVTFAAGSPSLESSGK